MEKPSPFVLPLSCGLFLCLLSGAVPAAPPALPIDRGVPRIDTATPRIELIPTAGSVLLSITGASRIPANIRLEWQVLQNGEPGAKGVVPTVTLTPGRSTRLRLPVQLPPGNAETWLRISGRQRTGVFQRFLLLRPWQGDAFLPAAGELSFTDSNDLFTISSPNTLIQFDKQTGWLLHYELGHALLVGDTAAVQPVLWPAIVPRLQLFSTSTGPQLVIVRTEYTLPETASLLHLSYTINGAGTMLVSQTLEPDTTAPVADTVRFPPLPGFGMRWLLQAGFDSIRWLGDSPADGPETLADTLVVPRIFQHAIAPATPAIAPATPAIAPPTSAIAPGTDGRENSYRRVRWLTVLSPAGTGLRIDADSGLIEAAGSLVVDGNSRTAHLRLDIGSSLASTAGQRPTKEYTYKVSQVVKTPQVIKSSPALAPRIHQQNR